MLKNIKEGMLQILGIAIGLPLMAAGFLLIVFGSMAVLFGIPLALFSSSNSILHTAGVVWGSLSVLGFFGYIMMTLGE